MGTTSTHTASIVTNTILMKMLMPTTRITLMPMITLTSATTQKTTPMHMTILTTATRTPKTTPMANLSSTTTTAVRLTVLFLWDLLPTLQFSPSSELPSTLSSM